MALDTIIVFESLRCIREEDSSSKGAEPYIWPVLVRIDDLTVNTASLVDIIAPALRNARVVIKSDMRAGESADIPTSVRLLRGRLEDNLFETRLILIIALWDEDETPEAAVRAGFQAFISELGAALGNASTLLDLQEGGEDGDEARKTIEDRVEKQVKSAIANSLTGPQKAAVKAGSLNLDDVIGSAFKAFPNAIPTPFALSFGKGSQNEFEIRGKIEVREVRVDRCQAQVNAVRNAQSAVDEVNRQIKKLKDDLSPILLT